MNKVTKIITFILKHIFSLAILVGLCFSGFFICMNMANLYVLVNDGFKERADVILMKKNAQDMSKYFSKYFMDTDSYKQLKDTYDDYDISSYGYNITSGSLWTWPWETRTEIVIHEAVYAIDGEINANIMSREEAALLGKAAPPEWKNASYKIVLVKQNDQWFIDSMKYLGDFTYVQPTKRSIDPELLESLRPTPSPTLTGTTLPAETEATPTPAATEESVRDGVITLDKENTVLNVRSGPGTKYEVIGQLSDGEQVKVLTTEGSWHKIKYGSKTGYVSSKYVMFDAEN